MEPLVRVLCARAGKVCRCPVRVVVLMMDIMVEVVLDCHVRASKAVVSLHNLYVESLCSPGEDAWKHCVELLFLYLYLPADAEENLDLVIKQVVRIACVLVAVVPELRELCDRISVESIVA